MEIDGGGAVRVGLRWGAGVGGEACVCGGSRRRLRLLLGRRLGWFPASVEGGAGEREAVEAAFRRRLGCAFRHGGGGFGQFRVCGRSSGAAPADGGESRGMSWCAARALDWGMAAGSGLEL